MIESDQVYYVRCDICGRYLEDRWHSRAQYLSLLSAASHAEDRGWYCPGSNKHYCIACKDKA